MLEGKTLLVHVEDAGARYPLTIDPLIEQAKLTASDGAAGDRLGFVGRRRRRHGRRRRAAGRRPSERKPGLRLCLRQAGRRLGERTRDSEADRLGRSGGSTFGISVAVSGDTVVVGADGDDVGANADQGSAYVFVKPGGGWASATETAKLTASDGAAGDRFGISVAVSGDTVVVGAPGDDVGANCRPGLGLRLRQAGGGWASATETAKLTASDGAAFDRFGFSVAVSGDTVVVGAFDNVGPNANQGSAYVFVKPGGGWASATETAKLTASDGAAERPASASSVAVSGDTVVVGASSTTSARTQTRARPTSSSSRRRLGERNRDGEADRLGRSGVRPPRRLRRRQRRHGRRRGASDDVGANGNQGSAYVFVEPGGGWVSATETAKLTASDGAANDRFGLSVAASGDTVVVGADGAIGDRGAAYVFGEGPLPVSSGLLRVTTNPALASQILIDGVIRDSWGASGPRLRPATTRLPSPTSRATASRRRSR